MALSWRRWLVVFAMALLIASSPLYLSPPSSSVFNTAIAHKACKGTHFHFYTWGHVKWIVTRTQSLSGGGVRKWFKSVSYPSNRTIPRGYINCG